ncbi:protein MIS12 homolog [Synchiropus splendidus]|uniref:protein MIS12 homolog n=1 Tax=Synchiropus splendidus TaxID=270530 RepID=UPI00237D33D5|nr:protein MIS12 homolog [Synchiropus splendidus]
MARESCEMDPGADLPEEADGLSSSSLKLYEAQFFGFTPERCMLRIQSAFQDCLVHILTIVEKTSVRQLGEGDAKDLVQTQVRECTRKLERYLMAQFEKLSARMEAPLVYNCLSIPANVLLPEDQAHKNYPDGEKNVQRLESSLANLQRAYEAEVGARRAMLEELEEQKEVQKQLDGLLLWVKELQGAWVTEGSSSFQESFRLVLESVKKLQDALREVCIKAPM